MGIVLECTDCGKIWVGTDECEAEAMMSMDPCECRQKTSQLTDVELYARLKKKGLA